MKHLLSRVSPEPKPDSNRRAQFCASGYWLCLRCHGVNTREEREQGLPPICEKCGSIRFKLQPPIMPDLLTPEDLRD